jgi:hypothetical protein
LSFIISSPSKNCLFYCNLSIDGKTTQPYTLTFNDNTGTYGTIIGWGPISTNIFVSGTAENFNNYIFYQRDKTTPYPTNVDYLDGYVFVKYPRSMLETTTDITNSFTATMNGIDGETSSSTASKNYTYVAVNFNYQGDNLKVIKANNLQLSGAMDVLQLGRDFSSSATYFSMYVNNRGWSLTNNDQDAYQTVLEDNLLFIDNKQLEPEDYSFTKFSISDLVEYGYVVSEETGYANVKLNDYTAYQPIEVYIKTLDNPDWTDYGTVKRSGSSYVWTETGGAEVTGSNPVYLPEGTYDIRFVHTGNQYEVYYYPIIHYKINATDHVQDLINGKTSVKLTNINSAYAKDSNWAIRSAGTSPTVDTTIKDAILASDDSKYGQLVAHAFAQHTLMSFYKVSNVIKSASKPTSDTVNAQESVVYTLTQYIQLNNVPGLTKEELIELNILNEQREGIFYDLLPAGTVVDTSSITARTSTYSIYSNNYTSCDYTVEMQENWEGSGRTMMILHVTVPDDWVNIDTSYSTYATTGFVVTFKLIDTWENINDYGPTVTNSVAYYSLNGNLPAGSADNGGMIKDKAWFVDLDNDGNTDATKKNVMYAENTVTFTPLTANELGFRKAVKASDDIQYSQEAEVAAGGSYNYQLRFANSNSVNTNDVVIYDVLESAYGNNEYWQGTLKGIDTTQIKNKGINVKIYYSTSSAFTNLTADKTLTDLTDTTLWQTTAPDDMKDVTAIAIDMRNKMDGTPYTFKPSEVALCYVSMEAPANYGGYVDNPDTTEDETVYAYNSAYLSATTTPVSGGLSSNSVEECSNVQVSLREPDVELHKTSNPASGTQNAPTCVQVGDTVSYSLAAMNTSSTESINNVKIEDDIPSGLTIDTENIKYYFGNASSSAGLVTGSARVGVTSSGQHLIFTVDKLAAGETIHLIIPTTVSEGSNARLFVNTAKITEFNGATWDIHSETTCHQTVPVLTDITVYKQWVDNENENGSHPESVTIHLYADGNEKENCVLTAENLWNRTFENLLKYDSLDGHIIQYTVAEETVSGYTTPIIGNAEQGFTITNTKNNEDTPTVPPEDNKTNIQVQKVWVGKSTDSVTIWLLADGKRVASYVLNEANQWKYTFSDFNKYEDGKEIQYTVEEEKINGYITSITGNATIGFEVTNTKKKHPTSDPDEPTTVTDIPENKTPTTVTDIPGNKTPTTVTDVPEDGTPTSGIPQTGDVSNIGLWLALAASSLLGLLGIRFLDVKKRNGKYSR